MLFADAGFPPEMVAGGLACIVFGVLASAAAVIVGLAWVFRRKSSTVKSNATMAKAGWNMRVLFASVLVVSGVLCLGVSVVSGMKLDSAYLEWSATKTSADAARPLESGRAPSRSYGPSLAGAPISVLSPVLIWLSVGVGLILIVIGLWRGLTASYAVSTSADAASSPSLDDIQSAERVRNS